MKIEKIDINKIKPYEKNAKIHTPEQIEQIKKSIQEFGMNDPIAVWGKDNLIVEGHGRLEALKQLGYTEVECIRLDHLTDEERRAYTLAHNKLTMNTDFDIDILNDELFNIDNIDMELFGFDVELPIEEHELTEDDYEVEVPEEPKAKPGDIYQLGEHRIMCGDSTSTADVKKLLAGETMDLVVTDPPYNVAIENSQGMTIENDNMSADTFQEFLNKAFTNMNEALKPGGAFYIWHASRTQREFETALNEAGLEVRQQLIWNKNSLVLGRQDYQWKHEPCMYGWKEGSHYFINARTETTTIEEPLDLEKLTKDEMKTLLQTIYQETPTTVIDEHRPSKNTDHPTMKPIKLIGRLIRNSSKPGEKVLDLFGGSGSTLIASEELDRKCYMMEYDAKYVDVIINRWEEFTGRKAEKING